MAAQSSPNYRPDIDGLRCIAILGVVLFHAGLPFVRGGFIGVDVFFVISGYLIGSHVYRETRSGTFTLGRFYERRARRILPAFLFVLSVCYGLGCILLSPRELKSLSLQALSALTSSSNLYFWLKTGYFAPNAEMNPLQMTWSLAVEEQFYVFFPLLMLLLKRLRAGHLLLVLSLLNIASFSLSIIGVHSNPAAAFYWLPARAWEIGVGCMIGIAEIEVPGILKLRMLSKDLLALVGVGALIASYFLYSADTPFPGFAALIPVAATALLIQTRETLVNRRLLSSRPLVWIGLISYSLYLWHWPLLSFAHICSGGPIRRSTGCLIALIALLMSVLTYWGVEQPFRRTRQTGRRLLGSYAFACAVLCIPAVLIFISNGWPSRYPRAAAAEIDAFRGSPDPCLANYGSSKPIISGDCMRQDTDEPVVALMGDSHASSLASDLRSESSTHGWLFFDLTKSSCPPLGIVTRAMLSHPEHAAECAAFNQTALRLVGENKRVGAVVLAGYWASTFPVKSGYGYVHIGEEARGDGEQNWSNFRSGLEYTVRTLRKEGKEVFISLDAPRFTRDPLMLTVGRSIPPRDWLGVLITGRHQDGTETEASALSAEDREASRIIIDIANRTGARIIDIPRALCDGVACRYSLGADSLYLDQQHLALSGSQIALRDAGLFESNVASAEIMVGQAIPLQPRMR